MKKVVILLLILLVALFTVASYFYVNSTGRDIWETRVENALASAACPPVGELPDFGPMYTGSLVDTHFHIPHIPDGPEILDKILSPSVNPQLGVNTSIGKIVCTLKTEGTSQVFAFFPVFPGIERTHLKIVNGVVEKYPDLFIPFIMPPDRDNDPDGFPTVKAKVLKEFLSIYPGLFTGYGEIGLYERGDHGGPRGAPALPPNSARLQEIYPIIRQHGLVVYFHLGEGQQAAFERVLSDNPDIKFIFHGDQLVKYENGGQNLQALDEILSRHPNAYYGVDELYGDVWLLKSDVSREQFFAHFKNYELLLAQDLATWKGFIERHPDQVLWGTDRGAMTVWSLDPKVGQVLTRYTRAFIGRLDQTVQEKFAYRNARSLIEN